MKCGSFGRIPEERSLLTERAPSKNATSFSGSFVALRGEFCHATNSVLEQTEQFVVRYEYSLSAASADTVLPA